MSNLWLKSLSESDRKRIDARVARREWRTHTVYINHYIATARIAGYLNIPPPAMIKILQGAQ